MQRYEIRGAGPQDEDALLALARFLNSVNLPNDRESIRRLLMGSEASFSGAVPPAQRRYVFVLWDLVEQRAVGTSMIVAQHGQREAPYIYFDVIPEEKYSHAVDRHFNHQLLRLGFSYDGPTELGGLVVDPSYRKAPERLGLLISYVRFLFIAARRGDFKDELIAELLPPLLPDGTSHLWEALGRRFTGMSYAEADFLSSQDKAFIRDLFPSGVIHASLLSEDAQRVIGQVGAQTKGVEKMLRRIGFTYAERVDPFDGGPHFIADTDRVTLVRHTLALPTAVAPGDAGVIHLVGRLTDAPPYFTALRVPAVIEAGAVKLTREDQEQLGATPGEPVYALPLSPRATLASDAERARPEGSAEQGEEQASS
ncbi:MAG: arginine N-succinyltransferase [Polyangiaceae bacterium]|nr:arginine N-succinyltransferase [Polyangiaceae bacterium]MCW5790490.1 arginine N-succinyltransferase [Polyangiaceae bacterium]